MRWIAFSLIVLPLAAEPITFNKHIAPLMFHYCSSCHRPGEAAPFSLLTYADARKHATQIVTVTERRYMPPWLPEPGYGDFAGERRLSADQLQLIAEWVKRGSIEGETVDLQAIPHFTEAWK